MFASFIPEIMDIVGSRQRYGGVYDKGVGVRYVRPHTSSVIVVSRYSSATHVTFSGAGPRQLPYVIMSSKSIIKRAYVIMSNGALKLFTGECSSHEFRFQ